MFEALKERIATLERSLKDTNERLADAKKRGDELYSHGKHYSQQVDEYFDKLIRTNKKEADGLLGEKDVHLWGGWDNKKWDEWECGDASLESLIRIGRLSESNYSGFEVPATVPFIGGGKTIIIKSNSGNANQGLELLRSILVRTAMILPHQARYTLLDPAGNGLNFPMSRHLPMVRESQGDVRRDLDGVIKDIQRIIHTYLDASTQSFEQVNEEIRVNERFEFIFAADFPNKYDRRAIEALQNIANTGTQAGTYLFIHHNTKYDLPRDMSMTGFDKAHIIDLDSVSGAFDLNFDFYPDADPAPDLQTELFDKLRQAKPPERILDWEEAVGLDENEWWTGDSQTIIESPVGSRGGRDEKLNVWFGANQEGRPCAHGMLGAMTGAGKSNLYHGLILGLAIRYSPEELQFYLVDGKDGVEFQPYKSLPHVQAISLRSSPELSRSVLAELLEEKERRNSLFSDASVTDFSRYREAGSPGGKLPRILLLVDEYQELFEGDTDGIASNQLLQLAQQGRSVGIHMLLASQRYGAAGMLNTTAIFGNIHLRMAMQMTRSDVEALQEFGRQGRQLILMTCNMPGKLVLNDQSGDDSANHSGKVAFMESSLRGELIKKLNKKAKKEIKADVLPKTIVFDGKEQPNFIENSQVADLLSKPKRLAVNDFEEWAREPYHEGGLGIADWFAAEHPHVVWLGQEFNVRGQASAVIKRRVSENALIIGSNNPCRYGLMAAFIKSLALNSSPEDVKFFIADRTIPGTPWSETLSTISDEFLHGLGYSVELAKENKDITSFINALNKEFNRRNKMGEAKLTKEPSIFVVMAELDRADDLRRKPDVYGLSDSALGEKLKKLYLEGPSKGIHLVVSFSGVQPMSHVIDPRQGLFSFRHRIGLQMSEDESHTFMRSRKASQLQLDGPKPINALYLDVESDKVTKFKPYSIESSISLPEQLKTLSDTMIKWEKK